MKTVHSCAALLAASAAAVVPGRVHALECKVVQGQPDVVSYIPEAPSYFTKAHASGDYAFYIGSGNHVLFLEDDRPGTRVKPVPGGIDPVPSSDGKILTIPGLTIYSIDDIMRDGRGARPLFEDHEHGGVYQSVAVLDGDGDERVYRVLTDSNELNYRDYKIDFATQPPTVQTLGPVSALCPGRNLQTIMISKTAKYVGVYDPETGTSKIVSGDGQCRELLDLGYATGKIEFRYDDTRITFHIDYFDSDAGGYFSGVQGNTVKDVYVMDIAEQADGRLLGSGLRRLSATLNKGSGGYYPSFDAHGRVIYVFDDSDQFAFHRLDPEDVKPFAFDLPPVGGWPGGQAPAGLPADWRERLHGAAALGSLWVEQCHVEDAESLTAVDAASYFMSMSRADCQELAGQWTAEQRQRLAGHRRFSRDTRFSGDTVRSLEQTQLTGLCRDNGVVARETRYFGQAVRERLTGQRVLHYYCVGCHDGPSLHRDDGTVVPNTLDFYNLSESQILGSLARIHLPEWDEHRMPPARSAFAPPFELDGETVDHRQVAIDYLGELLAQVRQGPPAVPAVSAPSGTACYQTTEEWLAFRGSIAHAASTGNVDYGAVLQRLNGCQSSLESLEVADCFQNLRSYARVQTLPRAGRKLDFEVSDLEYYRSIPREAVSLPTAAEGIDLTAGIPDDWRRIADSRDDVHALQYRSRTVVNPGNVGSLNRLLFLVEGERYDKWIQFTLPEPDTRQPDQNFDPTGLVHGTGPERLIDFIAVDKTVTPHKIYFAQFWRDASGRNPQPRLRAYREAYGMASEGVDAADTCYSCHPSGMRRLSPQPGSVNAAAVDTLELFNEKMAAYTARAPFDWHGAIQPAAYGPSRGADIGCTACHNSGEVGNVARLNLGPLTYKQAASHLRHKMLGDLSMPVERFVHNPAQPEQPIAVGAVVGWMKTINLLPDAIRIPLSKFWIDGSRSESSEFPGASRFAADLQGSGVFERSFWELFPEGNRYLGWDAGMDFQGLQSNIGQTLAYRQELLTRLEDQGRYRRFLGHWINQTCMASAIAQ